MHVVLAVEDVERAKRFYDDAFGWKPHLEWPDRYAELVLSDVDRLGPLHPRRLRRERRDRAGGDRRLDLALRLA